MESAEIEVADTLTRRARLGLVLGPALFVLMLVVPAPEGLSAAGWRVAATGVLMAVWWVTEPIPIPATALLPLALFPLLGVSNIQKAASPYARRAAAGPDGDRGDPRGGLHRFAVGLRGAAGRGSAVGGTGAVRAGRKSARALRRVRRLPRLPSPPAPLPQAGEGRIRSRCDGFSACRGATYRGQATAS